MGWRGIMQPRHWVRRGGKTTVDRKAECDEIFSRREILPDGTLVSVSRVLKSAMVGTTWYGAVETVRGGKASVAGAVCPTDAKGRDGYALMVKPETEATCPLSADCPVCILKLLTPTDSEAANCWRSRCRLNAEKRRDASPPPSA